MKYGPILTFPSCPSIIYLKEPVLPNWFEMSPLLHTETPQALASISGEFVLATDPFSAQEPAPHYFILIIKVCSTF